MMQTGWPRPSWSGGRSGSSWRITSCVRNWGGKLGRRSPGAMEERRRGLLFLGECESESFSAFILNFFSCLGILLSVLDKG